MTDSGTETVSDAASREDLSRNVSSMSEWLLWAGQSKAIGKDIQSLTPRQKTAVLDVLKRMSTTCKTRGGFFDYSGLERLVTAIEQDIPSMEVLVDPYLWPRKLTSRQAVILGRGLLKNISEMKEGRQLVQHGLLYQYGGVKKAFKLAAGGDFGAFDDIGRALESLRRDLCGDPIAGNMAKSIDYVCACMGSKVAMGRVSQAIAQMRSEGIFATSYEDTILRAAENAWQFLAWSEPEPQWDTAAEYLYLASVECDFLKDDLRDAFPHQRFGEWFTDSRPVVPESGIRGFLKHIEDSNHRLDGLLERASRGPVDESAFKDSGSEMRGEGLSGEVVRRDLPSLRVVRSRVGTLGLGSRDFEGGRFDGLLQPLPLIPAPKPDFVYETLMGEFPWMEEANEAVAMACAISDRRDPRFLKIPPLMLVGPSGAGKSRWTRRMAEITKVHYHRENMAGVYGTMEISGNAHGWKDARPSLPAVVMATGMIANPIILLDEIDKTAAGSAGDPVEALLPMLEEETARNYSDPCLMATIDLSMISFLFTANSESSLGTPFMDRLKMVRATKPTVVQFERTLPAMLDGIAMKLKLEGWDRESNLLDRTLKVYVNGGSLRSALAFAEREMSATVWSPKRPGDHLKLV